MKREGSGGIVESDWPGVNGAEASERSADSCNHRHTNKCTTEHRSDIYGGREGERKLMDGTEGGRGISTECNVTCNARN